MKITQSILTAIIFCFLSFSQALAQDYHELALLFGQTSISGTARFQGIAGAGTALGGDLSSAAINPAGLGFINKKNLGSFTTAFGFNNTQSSFIGSSAIADNTDKLNAQIGLSFYIGAKAGQAYKGGSFSINLTQQRDLGQNISYRGNNSNNSFVDFLIDNANGTLHTNVFDQADFSDYYNLAGLAYGAYLISPVDVLFADDGTGDELAYPIDLYTSFGFEPVNQYEQIERKGALQEWDFAYGGNFNDKIYVGASLGVQSIKYNNKRRFIEGAIGQEFEMQQLQFLEELDIKGTGVNLELGAIFRLSNYFRLGITATTPSVIKVTEFYEASMTASYRSDTLLASIEGTFEGQAYATDITVYNVPSQAFASTGALEAEYKIVTPYRLKIGTSVFVGKKGFLSADIEYVGYKASRLKTGKSNGFDAEFEFQNEVIKELYQNAFNFRLGGEARLGKKFLLRTGFAHESSPQAGTKLADGRTWLTGGIGYKSTKYSIDFALVSQLKNDFFYSPYSLGGFGPTAAVSETAMRGVLTFGFKF